MARAERAARRCRVGVAQERSRAIRRPIRRPPRRDDEPRINHRIRKSPVRLIDENGGQVGVVELDEARRRAEDVGLDLVEVGPTSDPPVVKILDWGKLKYEREKQAREARKKTHTIEVKEVKYRPNIDKHDMERKTDRVLKFLAKGKKVKVTVFFRYRQLRRPELGTEILDRLTEAVSELGVVETRTGLESRRMVMVIAPLKTDQKPKSAAPAPAKKSKQKASAPPKSPPEKPAEKPAEPAAAEPAG